MQLVRTCTRLWVSAIFTLLWLDSMLVLPHQYVNLKFFKSAYVMSEKDIRSEGSFSAAPERMCCQMLAAACREQYTLHNSHTESDGTEAHVRAPACSEPCASLGRGAGRGNTRAYG